MAAEIWEYDGIVIQILALLGPKRSVSLGSTCQSIRTYYKSDALWKTFFNSRAFHDRDITAEVHKAAWMWRHELQVIDRISQDEGENIYFKAYAQKHISMRLTNLRLEGRHDSDRFPRYLPQLSTRQQLCTQTWPGQLSLVMDDAIGSDANRIVCHNSAEAWCDHPSCNEARCGPQGCLRCYRFLPRDYSLSANRLAVSSECSQRNYDCVRFYKCSWCSVSFCEQHCDRFYQEGSYWFKCDECGVQSCPDCWDQLFLEQPDFGGCQVVTAGERCRRRTCPECTWNVGLKASTESECPIPGGVIRQESEIISIKGNDAASTRLVEVEKCCSKCLRHVQFRRNEMDQIAKSFGGLIP